MLASLAGAPLAARLQMDNSIRVWRLPGTPATAAYDRWRAVFGDDDWLVVGARPASSPLSPAGLGEVRRLTEALERLPGVGRTISLWTYFRDSRGIEAGRVPPVDEVKVFEEEVLASPFFENDLLRRSTGAAGIYLEVTARDPAASEALGTALNALAASERASGRELHWGGVSAIAFALDAASRREIALRFPIGVAVAALLVWWSGMPVPAVLLTMVLAGLASLASLGALSWAGHSLNMVLTILPSLVFFVTLTYGVFVAHALAGAGLAGPLEQRLKRIFVPVTDSMVCTVVGLLALELCAFPVLRHLGRFGALGVFFGMLLPFCAMPIALAEGVPCDRGPQPYWARRNPRNVLVFWALSVLVALPGVTMIRAEMDPLSFLPPDDPVRSGFAWISANLTGLSPLEVVIEHGVPLTDPAALRALDGACASVRGLPGVSRVLGPADWLARFEQNRAAGETLDPAAYRVPDAEEPIRAALTDDDASPFLRRFVTKDLATWHVHVRTTVERALAFAQLKDRVVAQFAAAFPRARVSTYGQHALIKEMEGYLVSSTFESLGVAWLIIATILVARAPSLKLGAWAVVPNTLPLVYVLATMGYFGVPLDVGTSMVMAVATGLSADNTFHVMERYGTARAAGMSQDEAITRTLDHAAAPMLQSSLLTSTLFLVLATSPFAPVRWFGILNALSIISSVLLDLTFLPAYLRWTQPR